LLVLPRAAAGTRGQYSTLHCTGTGRGYAGEQKRRGNEGEGEGTKELAQLLVEKQQELG